MRSSPHRPHAGERGDLQRSRSPSSPRIWSRPPSRVTCPAGSVWNGCARRPQSGAGSSKCSDSIRNNRREIGDRHSSPTGRLHPQSKPARNGSFWCGDQRPDIALRRASCATETGSPELVPRKAHKNATIFVRLKTSSSTRIEWWRRSVPNWLLPTQSSNQSPKLRPGTEFFAEETGRRNGLVRGIAEQEIAGPLCVISRAHAR
jgi:hypothetical protein